MILSLGDAGPTTMRNQEVREVDGTRHWFHDRKKLRIRIFCESARGRFAD